MTTTTFTSGTVIASAWLNDVNRKTYVENVSVGDFATVALAAASGANSLVFPAGTYTLAASTTFPMPVHMMPGAVITVPTGMTLTFSKAFTAGLYQVFDCVGTGAVVFDFAYSAIGCPEWWGAIGQGGSGTATANVNAINAAMIACRATYLQATTYYTNSRLLMGLQNRALIGTGQHYNGADAYPTTRVYNIDSTSTIIQIGPDAYPGSANALHQGNVVADITFTRGIGPDIPLTAKGVVLQYTLYAELKNVRSHDSIYGFMMYGTINCTLERCYAFRSTAGTGVGTDLYYGFYINGTPVISGLNGGNASLFLVRCNASIDNALGITNSNGYYLDSAYGLTDVFMDQPESTFTNIGINIQGNLSNTTINYTNANVKIRGAILDGFAGYGIYITNLNKFGGITITDPYLGAQSGATAAIAVVTCAGSAVDITSGQALLKEASGAHGLLLTDSDNITVRGLQIIDARGSGVEMSNLRTSHIAPVVKNQTALSNAAVRMLNTCTRNYIAPIASGAAAMFPLGIQLVGASHGYNEFNCTGIDPAALAGGLSSGKLNNNGTAITATGLFGTNLANGVMA